MEFLQSAFAWAAFGPVALMLLALLLARWPGARASRLWATSSALSYGALACSLAAVFSDPIPNASPWLVTTPLGSVLAILVQFLGTVIGAFSARYLHGEASARRYLMALAGVLASVHLLLMAGHWLVLIAAWSFVGYALQFLLCFYPDRPFALLAAHKKRLADRLADVLLTIAAGLAWWEVGSGSLADLKTHVARNGLSPVLHASAVLLVVAVVLRTALLPVHGWLTQVMEAPTPVSALLHAGVVNLGGHVLILFGPLLEQATVARWLLVVFGLGTAVLAGLVMLTRVSIKVRLAWSTVAQMGFMVLECGLGLYTLAALHLVGHSLYKAHAFLSASTVVRQTRLKAMRGVQTPLPISLWIAPGLSVAVVLTIQTTFSTGAWPWWWGVLLGLAWAPLLWMPAPSGNPVRAIARGSLSGITMIAGLTGAALLAHTLPMGLKDSPHPLMGAAALLAMGGLYAALAVLQARPKVLETWRRWSYAGFYLDEYYTRLTLLLWPTGWAPMAPRASRPASMDLAAASART